MPAACRLIRFAAGVPALACPDAELLAVDRLMWCLCRLDGTQVAKVLADLGIRYADKRVLVRGKPAATPGSLLQIRYWVEKRRAANVDVP